MSLVNGIAIAGSLYSSLTIAYRSPSADDLLYINMQQHNSKQDYSFISEVEQRDDRNYSV